MRMGAGAPTAADLLNRAEGGRPGADPRRLRRRAPRAPSGAGDRPAPGARSVRDRATTWSTRSARCWGRARAPGVRPAVPGGPHRGQRRARRARQRRCRRFRDALEPGGALAVITYHSGEDRLVKQAFRDWASACICPPRPAGLHLPRPAAGPARAAQADRADARTRSPPTRGPGAPSSGSSRSSDAA